MDVERGSGREEKLGLRGARAGAIGASRAATKSKENEWSVSGLGYDGLPSTCARPPSTSTNRFREVHYGASESSHPPKRRPTSRLDINTNCRTSFSEATTSKITPSEATPTPKDALLEVQQIKPAPDAERSWFVDQNVVSDGALTLLTIFDPAFLILSLLSAPSLRGMDAFLSAADLWDKVSEVEWGGKENEGESDGKGVEMREDVLRFADLECVQRRMAACCEVKEHDGVNLYRYSPTLALTLLQTKIDALSEAEGRNGLFGPYEKTTLGEAKAEAAEEDAKEGMAAKSAASGRPHPTVSRALAREGLGDGVGLSEAIQKETRQKSAIGILSNYLPPPLSAALLASYSFPLLTAHLSLSSTTTSSVLGMTYLPGRRNDGSVPASSSNGFGAAAAERDKKRKLESARTSRGVKELKGVNTKGMMKLTDMFKKGPVVKKVVEKKAADDGDGEKEAKKRKVEGGEEKEGVRKSPRRSKG
ncbi:ribonuclease H2 subunit B, partial [Phenoliferia sp. Uapishka_3]